MSTNQEEKDDFLHAMWDDIQRRNRMLDIQEAFEEWLCENNYRDCDETRRIYKMNGGELP